MSSCIKDLNDYELVEKCCRRGIVKLKSNFLKRSKSSEGYDPRYKFCIKEYYVDIKDRLLNKQKFYNKENSDRIKEYQLKNDDKIIAQKRIYSNNIHKSVKKFRLICRTKKK